MHVTVSLATLALGALCLALGSGTIGYVAALIVRRIRVALNPCNFCNGHGYFASVESKNRTLAQVHEESSRWAP